MAATSDLGIVRDKIAGARSLAVLTGAGISADSGVPTFRGADGLWRNFRAEDLATPEAFERDPRLVWEWYNWRRELIATKQPNAAHAALVELEHPKAGSQRLSEIHGNIWRVRCTECGMVEDNHDVPIPMLPTCAHCHGLLRPHIVWFGESLFTGDLSRCAAALQSCDVLLVIGTSGVVYPAAGFASVAKQAGAFVAEINPDSTPHSDTVDVFLKGRAKEVVPLLL
jgi:NAD-dependent deacetylase